MKWRVLRRGRGAGTLSVMPLNSVLRMGGGGRGGGIKEYNRDATAVTQQIVWPEPGRWRWEQ